MCRPNVTRTSYKGDVPVQCVIQNEVVENKRGIRLEHNSHKRVGSTSQPPASFLKLLLVIN